MPDFRVHRFDNGLELWVAERHQVPEVSLRLILEGGASAESAREAGVAELTGRLLTEGAGARDAMGVADWLDHLGAVFHARVSYDVATLSLRCLSQVTRGALELLATVARQPAFAQEEVERVREERLDEIERERDEPAILADRGLISAIYGSHLYGRPIGGIRDSVAGLDAEAVRCFHDRRYGASSAKLIICGDVGPEEVQDWVGLHFGDWREGSGRVETPPAPRRAEASGELRLIHRPGSAQSEIRVGAVGARHGSEDHFPILVANAILGGLFNSRINMNLREDKGWTYGARTSFRLRRGAGPFVAQAAVETAVTEGAFSEILAEIRGLRERPPSEEEMRLARNALTLSLPLQFETSGQVSRKMASRLVYGLPEDYWETYADRVAAVSGEQVRDVAERYLGEDALTLVAVSDAERVSPELEGFRAVRTAVVA
ncbi:MAG: M16 family metallopeptidase [Gemmatimonadota bacterium]